MNIPFRLITQHVRDGLFPLPKELTAFEKKVYDIIEYLFETREYEYFDWLDVWFFCRTQNKERLDVNAIEKALADLEKRGLLKGRYHIDEYYEYTITRR